MGVVQCPSLDDYWVPQVATLMSSKVFRLLRRMINFNDYELATSSTDRFLKVRLLFNFLNKAFRTVPQTPKQSIDEIITAYKVKTAGNMKQFVPNKSHQFGFKCLARASDDGFVHDLMLYQGPTTVPGHGIPVQPKQEALGPTNQFVSVLVSTMTSLPTAIFADNFFSSLDITRYLKEKDIRYTGTCWENRVSNSPLMMKKEMEKSVPCGTYDYACTSPSPQMEGQQYCNNGFQ